MISRVLCCLLLLSLLGSCKEQEPATQIVISVATDYEVPDDLSKVHFLVETLGGDDGEDRVDFDYAEVLTAKSRRDFPLTLALTGSRKSKAVVRVTVTGQLAGDSIVRHQALASFRPGKTLWLPMNLLERCRDELCEDGKTSCSDSGRCESVVREDLTPWKGDVPGLDASTPMADGATNDPPLDGNVRRDGSIGMDGSIGRDGGTADGGVGTDSGVHVQPNIVSLAVGFHNSCAVLRSGRVYCWGGNERLALGSRAEECPNQVCTAPRLVPDVTDAIHVTAGERFSCALTKQGHVWCWGANYSGQAGAPESADPTPPTRVRFQAMPNALTTMLTGIDALASSRFFSCARVAATKGLVCWGGKNTYRELPADVSDVGVAIPTTLTSDVADFALGHFHGCFISGAGALSCWGLNSSAQVGVVPVVLPERPTDFRLPPVTVFTSGATDVAAGEGHTCAIVDGDIKCFGLAGAGQLGVGPLDLLPACLCTPPIGNAEAPTANPPVAPSPAVSLALGTSLSCARYQDGRVACWGDNQDRAAGQPGVNYLLSPAIVPQLAGTRLLAAGYGHVCAATNDEIYCWGANSEGQLGPNATIGTSSSQLNAVPIPEAP